MKGVDKIPMAHGAQCMTVDNQNYSNSSGYINPGDSWFSHFMIIVSVKLKIG